MIEIDTLTKSFGPTRALAGVSFRVGAGEIVGLLGPNGAGKTTLVRVVATLLRPDCGTVRVDGIDVTLDPQGVRERIGLAGQAAAVDALLTGRENLELIGGLYGLDGPARRMRAAGCSSGSTSSTPPTGAPARTPGACAAASTSAPRSSVDPP
jgi:ABC-2 type transport system ATP-binding protein